MIQAGDLVTTDFHPREKNYVREVLSVRKANIHCQSGILVCVSEGLGPRYAIGTPIDDLDSDWLRLVNKQESLFEV